MNKDFDTLEKIGLHMADNFYSPITPEGYAIKVVEEMAELKVELESANSPITKLQHEKLKDELGDVLFTVLRFSNCIGLSGNDLLHHATTKLLARVKNPNYNKA